ncbi:MAG: hypothetical protein PHS98_04615 [Bacilli bacterium]|nr:hypothetical protein [Bacilli bacterium]
MGTPFAEIDNMFLSDINDSTILEYTEDERTEILNNLRKKAIPRFKCCKADLTDKDEIFGEFKADLTDEEKLILATIMRKYWLNDKIYNLNLLKQRLSTKDWRMTSQAEHLLRLTVLAQELDKEISRMIVDYSVYNYKI